MNPIEKLIAGYHRFRDGYYEKNSVHLASLTRLGQSPKIAIVACCDSRVDPSVITDSSPGDLFVIRNVANLVPPCELEGAWHGTSAALQFAVCDLEVEHIIILGHAGCGGIRALLEENGDREQGQFITSWMSIVDEARKQVFAKNDYLTFDEQARACVFHALEISLANLQTFPWIVDQVAKNRLQLHGWYYDMVSGDILRVDTASKSFVSL